MEQWPSVSNSARVSTPPGRVLSCLVGLITSSLGPLPLLLHWQRRPSDAVHTVGSRSSLALASAGLCADLQRLRWIYVGPATRLLCGRACAFLLAMTRPTQGRIARTHRTRQPTRGRNERRRDKRGDVSTYAPAELQLPSPTSREVAKLPFGNSQARSPGAASALCIMLHAEVGSKLRAGHL